MIPLLRTMSELSGIVCIPIKSQQTLTFSLLVFYTTVLIWFVGLVWLFEIIVFLTYEVKLPREDLRSSHIIFRGPTSQLGLSFSNSG